MDIYFSGEERESVEFILRNILSCIQHTRQLLERQMSA